MTEKWTPIQVNMIILNTRFIVWFVATGQNKRENKPNTIARNARDQNLDNLVKDTGHSKVVLGRIKTEREATETGTHYKNAGILSESSSVCLHWHVNKVSCRSGVNINNLVRLKPVEQKHHRLKFLYLNVRWVGNKAEVIHSMIVDEKIRYLLHYRDLAHQGDTDNVTKGQLIATGYSLIHEPRVTRGGDYGPLSLGSRAWSSLHYHCCNSQTL